jgi:hypothetical protein
LKVGLRHYDTAANALVPSDVTDAYFVAQDFTTTKSSTLGAYPSDIPGAVLVVSKLMPTFKIMTDGLLQDKLTIAFKRPLGRTDTQVSIDASVENTAADGTRTRSKKAATDFQSCISQLVKRE